MYLKYCLDAWLFKYKLMLKLFFYKYLKFQLCVCLCMIGTCDLITKDI